MSKRSIFEEVGDKVAVDTPKPVAAEAARVGGRAAVRIWLIVLLALVALMVIVGGLTRLTDSGLSITEWNVVMGALPPLSQADWIAAFDAYKTTDEYKLQNSWMELADFKPIFWWEWGHRFLGRFLGLVWAVGLIYFAVRKQIPRGWLGRLILIGALGGLQGAVGWWMVYSGLSDRVDVAPYRLATHLGIAFVIFAFISWYILKIGREEWELLQARRRRISGLFGLSIAVTTLLFLQILLGALVAGNDAGLMFLDWPLMHGDVFPADAFELTPFWANFFENVGLVQFMHRITAYALMALAIYFLIRTRRSGHERTAFWGLALSLGILLQAGWGVLTLVHAAPMFLALVHQLAALGLLWLAMRVKFEIAYPSEQKITA
ncbi:MAG: COX15/CtaA family protein [Pseudomonadota bacterium]